MNLQIFRSLFVITCMVSAMQLSAQTLVQNWAKQIYSLTQVSAIVETQMITDRHGNLYAMLAEQGPANIGGGITDSASRHLLVSWDCDGNFRWMKKLGENNLGGNFSIATDTMDGVYVLASVYVGNSDTIRWDQDTSVFMQQGMKGAFLLKYNSLGQFQWCQVPVLSYGNNYAYDLQVSPSGDVFWLGKLLPGTYNGGLTITAHKYYVVQHDAAGNFQTAIPLDISGPGVSANYISPSLRYDPGRRRFYIRYVYDNVQGLWVGSTLITSPPPLSHVLFIGAFDSIGNSLWVRPASPDTLASDVTVPAIGGDGTLYLGFGGYPGDVFCGDTLTNPSGGGGMISQLMALDTNGNVLWTNRIYGTSISDVHLSNNTVVGTGRYGGSFSWGNKVITSSPAVGAAYVVRADATTGTVIGLEGINFSNNVFKGGSCVDRTGNIYVFGTFYGYLIFGTDTLGMIGGNTAYHYIARYKNALCNCDLLQPDFSYATTLPGNSVYQFTYTGQTPYISISWDFGDGTPPVSSPSPIHTYAQSGKYTTCVTAVNGCGSSTSCKNLYVVTDVNDPEGRDIIRIYPNPVGRELMVEGVQMGTLLQVFDLPGRLIGNQTATGELTKMNVGDLPAGSYLLRCVDKEGRSISKIFVKE